MGPPSDNFGSEGVGGCSANAEHPERGQELQQHWQKKPSSSKRIPKVSHIFDGFVINLLKRIAGFSSHPHIPVLLIWKKKIGLPVSLSSCRAWRVPHIFTV
jgi:hypothetical protein